MRRTFQFSDGMPTRSLSLLIQTLGNLVLWFACLLIAGQAQAVAPITPSGLNTQINFSQIPPAGKVQYDITGGTRAGTNLFHSFGDFSVPTNNIANFLNTPVNGVLPFTSNILGRITGGNSSNIFGTVQTTGFGSANLFLMNPAGFLFGPNATVNVGGMVAFTTADYLRLADGVLFNAIPNAAADALLSAAPVAAFGFLGSNPAAIAVQGSTLAVQPGQSISLVGGNEGFTYTNPDTGATASVPNGVTVTGGNISARGGQVNIASVASPGEILTRTLAQAPNINGQTFGALGTIQISEHSVIDVSGNGGGTVLIRGGQFLLDNSTISANVTGPGPVTNGVESIGGGIDIVVSQDAVIQSGAVLETNVLGNATPGVQYGGVHVKADRIQIIGTQDFDNAPFTGIRSDVAAGSTGGSSGNITLEGNSILIQDLGTFTTTLETITGGAGNAGNIVLNANGNLDLDGATIQSMSQSASGNAGNIALTSSQGDITMTNFPLIQSSSDSGSGNAGNITMTAQGNISMDGPFISADSQSGTGDAGNITLTSTQGNISMVNFPVITSQTSDSSGSAGNITVSAPSGDILLAGGAFPGFILTAIRPPVGEAPRTEGSGQIQITAHNLSLLNSTISGDNISQLRPGNIDVTLSGTLSLSGTSFTTFIQTTSRGSAPSADLTVSAHDIRITDGGHLSTETFLSGSAGNLNIFAQNLQLTNGAQVRSGSTSAILNPGQPHSTPSGPGGTITIQGVGGHADSVLIDGVNSGILTNTEGTGAGGNINLSANSVTLQTGGTLSAATSGTMPTATGGAITVTANQVQLSNGGLITVASTGPGASGAITIGVGGSFAINGGTVSSTATQATGGDINITAGQSVALTNGASVSASSTGAGNAGNILINAGQSFAATNSSVTTQAAAASGGTIKISTSPSGTVQLTNSTISASVLDGTGGGGSVNIDPQFVILQNSQILAQAVQGPGGNISITTNLLLPDASSVISASSQFGQNGTITIQSPISPAGGKILPLSQRPLLATALLSQRCAALAGGEFSSFTVAGRDSLPAEPGGWLSSPLAMLSAGMRLEARGEGREGMTLGASFAGETALLSLRQIAPPGFLTQAFAVDWSAGCTS